MTVRFFQKQNAAQRIACVISALVLGCGLISDRASAQQALKPQASDSNAKLVIAPAPVLQAPKVVDFAGLGWGLGIATNFDVGGRRVTTASVVNNVVRVGDNSSNVGVSFLLEAHYFLRDYNFSFGGTDCKVKGRNGWDYNCTELAHGPFVAIEVGGGSSASPAANGVISGYVMGWMVGMRHNGLTPEMASPTASWNLGVGLRVTPNSQVFGDGIVANQPLPAGDTLRFKNEPRLGVTVVSTFSF